MKVFEGSKITFMIFRSSIIVSINNSNLCAKNGNIKFCSKIAKKAKQAKSMFEFN